MNIVSLNLSAQKFGLQWVDQLVGSNSTNNIQHVSLAIDNSGSIYAAFTFIGTVDFDPSPSSVTAIASGTDIFVAKYTEDGELTSDRFQLANAADQRVNDIVVDSQGNIYITGNAEGLVNYSPTGIAANIANIGTTGKDIFLAKYTETGQFVWVKTYGSSTDAEGLSLAIDQADNLYLAGKFRGTMSVLSGGVTSSLSAQGSLSDMFLARFQNSGTLDWAYRFGEAGEDVAQDVVFDESSQSVIITGAYQGTVDFDPGQGEVNLSSTIFADNSFLAKYSNAGIIDWAISFGGGNSLGNGIAVDDNSNVYVTGYFQTTSPGADFDPSQLNNALLIAKGTPDGYIAKYDANGNYLWAKALGAGFGIGGSLSVTPASQLIATGVFSGNIDYGKSQLVETATATASYIARFEADGTFLSHASIAESNNFEHTMIEGNLLIGGRLRGNAEFDPIDMDDPVSSLASYDLYIARYDVTGPQLVKNNTSDAATFGTDLTVNIEVEDKESAVQSVALDYRGVSAPNASAFKRITLTKKSGNQFEGTIPSDDFDELGIEFRGFAINTLGVESTTELITRPLNVPDGITIPQYGSGNGDQEDYRIIAIPLQLNSNSVKSIFEDDLGKYDPLEYRLFGYTGQTTQLNANSPLEPGKGYWIIIAGNDRPMNTGAGKTLSVAKGSPFTLSLTAGWNLIGNPYYFNIGWPEMKIANPGIGDIRIYDGSFSNGTVLDAMTGGFLFTESATTISFPVTKNPLINGGRTKEIIQQNIRTPLQPGEWEVLLNLSQQDKSYNLGGIGMRADAKIEYDAYDNMTLPRFGNYLELNHNKELLGFYFTMDVVPTASEESWEFTIESKSAGIAKLSWDQSSLSNLTNQLILFDIDNQWPVDMTTSSSYEFHNSGVHHFKAVYGSATFVKNELVTDQFVFHSIYPNPATDKIDLSFSTPVGLENENLSLSILSTLGQRVQHHSYTIAESGLHQVSIPLQQPTGIYIVQIELGDFRKQTRLVIK